MKRIGNSFKGIFGGFIAILIGVGLLWWNEGNNVRNIKTTAEMEKSYVDVKSDSVDSTNDGKLVATYGKLINEEELTDSTFGVTIKTPLMKRIVEVYQWDEDSSTDEDGNTTYTYEKKWSSDIIDSSSFHRKDHTNPTQKLYNDETLTSSNVKLNAFTLSNEQVNRLSTNGNFTDFNQEILTSLNLKVFNNYITTSEDLNNPQIGDTRISFVYNNSTDISVLAVQKGDSFVDFVSGAGKKVNRIMDGTHSGADMINTIKKENNILKWILRAVGIILLIAGFGTILKPLSAITSYVPIVGNLVDTAVGLVALLLGLSLGLIVIAIAWIRFRPLIGIGLLAAAGALIFLVVKKGKKDKPNDQQMTNSSDNMQNFQQPINNDIPQVDQNMVPPVENSSPMNNAPQQSKFIPPVENVQQPNQNSEQTDQNQNNQM